MANRSKKLRGKARNRKRVVAEGGASAVGKAGRDCLGEANPEGWKSFIPAAQVRNGASSTVLKQVGLEILREDLEPAAWAQALVEGSGTREDTLSHYARIRVAVLTEQEHERRNRKSDFELRQKSSFQDVGSVPVVPPGGVVKRKVLGCIDAVFWHAVAMVAGVGTLVAANLLWPELGLKLSWPFLIAAVVVMQLIPFLGWRAGRGGLTGVTYSQASQIAACLAMFGSVWVGCGLLMRHPPHTELMAEPAAPRVEVPVAVGGASDEAEESELSAAAEGEAAVAVSEER